MNSRLALICAMVIVVGLLSCRPGGDPIAIINHNFEALPNLQASSTEDGLNITPRPLGWRTSSGKIAVLNPHSRAIGTMDGPHILSFNHVPGGYAEQSTWYTVKPGETYILTVAVGHRASREVYGGWDIQLLDGSAILAQAAGTSIPVAGSFGDVTLAYTATSNDAPEKLGVRLIEIGGTSGYADYDNVRLSKSADGFLPGKLILLP